MAKLNKLFEIIRYEVVDSHINVVILKDNKELPVKITERRYVEYLKLHDKLEVPMTVHLFDGEASEPVNVSMTIEEYWQTSDFDIKQDIYDFILIRLADFSHLVMGFEDCIKAIAANHKPTKPYVI